VAGLVRPPFFDQAGAATELSFKVINEHGHHFGEVAVRIDHRMAKPPPQLRGSRI